VLGSYAGSSAATGPIVGNGNTSLGSYAGQILGSGSNNTFVGYNAGNQVFTGNNVNVFGNNALSNTPGDNTFWLSPGLAIQGATGPHSQLAPMFYDQTSGQVIFDGAYADLVSTTTQTINTVAYTESLAQFDNPPNESFNVYLAQHTGATGPHDLIYLPNAGTYEFSFNPQFSNSTTSEHEIVMYMKEGLTGATGPLVNIPNTSSVVTVPKKGGGGNNGEIFPYFSITRTCIANTYIAFGLCSRTTISGGNVSMTYFGPTGPAPENPSIISNIKRIF
jgi:hypothetical protein